MSSLQLRQKSRQSRRDQRGHQVPLQNNMITHCRQHGKQVHTYIHTYIHVGPKRTSQMTICIHMHTHSFQLPGTKPVNKATLMHNILCILADSHTHTLHQCRCQGVFCGSSHCLTMHKQEKHHYQDLLGYWVDFVCFLRKFLAEIILGTCE